ncbi:TonB-dependent receptor domain-containing protein, partial [Zhongshania sp.]|uniref:TonB-dependent receptor domain-containing protein n=1 Tax=Zhongshania sp. TaxID=1971902 RepID=UPI00356696A1
TFDGIFAVQTIGVDGETDSSGVSPRLLARYDLTDDVMLNAQVSKGFRLGGINDPLNAPLCNAQDLATYSGNPDFDDETIINYEVGSKMTIFNGAGSFNISAFYSEIKDLQVTQNIDSCSSRIILNVDDAHSQGVEMELSVRPSANLEVSIAASYNDAELDSDLRDSSGGIIGGFSDGNELPTAPDYSIALASTYYFEISDSWEGYVSGSFHSVGARYTQIGDQLSSAGNIDLTNPPNNARRQVGNSNLNTIVYDSELDNYQTVNLRIGGRTASIDLALFINNVTNEIAQQSLDTERGGTARVGYRVSQPRTAGITARYDF